MNPAYDFDDIDDYLHDRMSEADRKTFKQALETDAALAQQVEALRTEAHVLRLMREDALLDQFAEWAREEDEKKSAGGGGPDSAKIIPAYRQWMIPLAAAAAIALAIGAVAFGWFDEKKTDTGIVDKPGYPQDSPAVNIPVSPAPETPQQMVETPAIKSPGSDSRYAQLATRYYAGGDEFAQTLMGAGDTVAKSRYEKAVELYEAKDFRAALRQLERPDSTQLKQYLFLRAHTLYRLGRFEAALADFRAFRQFRFAGEKYDAQWGEAICLLQQMPGTESTLLALLREMQADADHPYHQKAAGLLRDISK